MTARMLAAADGKGERPSFELGQREKNESSNVVSVFRVCASNRGD